MRQPVPHAAELRDVAYAFIARVGRIFRGGSVVVVPQSRSAGLRGTLHIAVHHTLGQLCTVICLSSNLISYVHVIKAMEPLFLAVASRCILGQKMDVRVYLSLLPVVGGVVWACAGSDEFSWISFFSGMGSNVFFAMRGVVLKEVMDASTMLSRQR